MNDREALEEVIEAAKRRVALDPMDGHYKIRQRSVKGIPQEESRFFRSCRKCGASFIQLAPGKTGLHGIWHEWMWYCSRECAGETIGEGE